MRFSDYGIVIQLFFWGAYYLYFTWRERRSLGEHPTILDSLADFSLPCAFIVASLILAIDAAVKTQGGVSPLGLLFGIPVSLLGTAFVHRKRAIWNYKSPRAMRLKARQEARKTATEVAPSTSLPAITTVMSMQSPGTTPPHQTVGRQP
jgi:hypothetical protein